MKITQLHQDHICKTIKEYLAKTAKDRDKSVTELLADHIKYVRIEGLYNDLDKQIRWDVFSSSGLTPWLYDNVYPYANDVHVDTVLRRVMSSLGGVA